MSITIKDLGEKPYQATWEAMKTQVARRKADHTLPDEIWLLEHPPVFTQGQAGKPEHLLYSSDIPVIQTDRGGQITYHGPGQLIAYTLLDLKQREYSIRKLVSRLEASVIDLLQEDNISATTRKDRPGVYVDNKKIASIGLRVSGGFTYHGLSFNVDMDLAPFDQINPCGYSELGVTQLSAYVDKPSLAEIKRKLANSLQCIL
jgi:lipoyl(octanoyl) transferase